MRWKIPKLAKLIQNRCTGIKWSSAIDFQAPSQVSRIETCMSKAPVSLMHPSNWSWHVPTPPTTTQWRKHRPPNALPEFPSAFPIPSQLLSRLISRRRRKRKRRRMLMKTITVWGVRDLHSHSLQPMITPSLRVNSNAPLAPPLQISTRSQTNQI